jgi:DNA ligase-1
LNAITSPEIFKLDSKGKIRTWQYVVQGDSWATIAGLQDGNKVHSGWTKCVPASQPTAEAQAQFEAEAEKTKKLKRDYHETVEGTATAKYFAPMLAEKYDRELVTEGYMVQPKLDGIRCIATKDGLRTRKGEPITSCPHILEQLQSFFSTNSDAVLDGELYNHELKDNFNELASIIRKKTPDANQLARAARDIEFHVYDLVDPRQPRASALDRLAAFTTRLVNTGLSIQIVPTTLVDNHDEVRALFLKYVSLGYEGVMVRRGDAVYENKRTDALMKYKEFISEEYEISEILEGVGNWAGYAKAVEFKLPDDRRTEQGERPKAGIKGNQAFAKALLARKDELVGKKVTVKFFELTPAGIPRFPIAIDFDRPDA